MKKQSKASVLAMDFLIITIGTFIFCIAWEWFLIPNDIASGGLVGACTILEFATRGAVPVAVTFPIINGMLIIAGSIFLGRGFGVKTIYCIALSSVLFALLPKMEYMKAVEGNFLYLESRILVPIIGGMLESIGIGAILARGGSTGGTDIVAMVVNKFWPMTPGKVYLYLDIVTIACVLLVPGKTFSDMMYGYIAMIIFSMMIDYVLIGRKSSVKILVFSNEYARIADYINNEMERGVTALNAVGWYTKEERNVLLILASKSELHEITKVIKELDPKAFVSVSPTSSVFGEGFEEIKTGPSLNKKKKAVQ